MTLLCVQHAAGHQGENPEDESVPGDADGVSGRHPGEARSSSSDGGWPQQEEEGAVMQRCEESHGVSSRANSPSLSLQSADSQISQELVSLSEILEVSLEPWNAFLSLDITLL